MIGPSLLLIAAFAIGQGLGAGSASADPATLMSFESTLTPENKKKLMTDWCEHMKKAVVGFRWGVSVCHGTNIVNWRVGGVSVEGRPLVFAEFGNKDAPNTTLVLTAVHGDEITPLYLGLRLAQWLKDRINDQSSVHVVVAPLVNPDGFLSNPRTRTNARGVDVNRNFATSDWQEAALKTWKNKYRKDPRRFPGNVPRSEPETIFQEDLIRLVRPQKILSVHSPLNFMDYDGPSAVSLSKFPQDYVEECLRLRAKLKATPGVFFPGSLGNYAGRELGIPTMTLELPTADHRKAKAYWDQFSKGIQTMIDFAMPDIATTP